MAISSSLGISVMHITALTRKILAQDTGPKPSTVSPQKQDTEISGTACEPSKVAPVNQVK